MDEKLDIELNIEDFEITPFLDVLDEDMKVAIAIGARGEKGTKGDKGDKGDTGAAATVTVGTVTTGAAGTPVSVINSGTANDAILDFVIPKGDKGDSGVSTGDMLKSVYDTNNDGIVDKARYAALAGAADEAAWAEEAESAYKATNDGNSRNIVSTYATKAEIPADISELNNDAGYIDSAALSAALSQLMLMMHPVGTIKMTADNVNPSTYIGGTWELWGSGRVPVGVDASDTDFAASEKTGGSKTYDLSHNHSGTGNVGATTLTASQIPAHTHGEKELEGSFRLGGNVLTRLATSSRLLRVSGIVTASDATEAHDVYYHNGATLATNQTPRDTITITATHTHNSVGGGTSHTHTMGSVASKTVTGSTLQPYITCYMWKRTA